jgi:hypothetical protein
VGIKFYYKYIISEPDGKTFLWESLQKDENREFHVIYKGDYIIHDEEGNNQPKYIERTSFDEELTPNLGKLEVFTENVLCSNRQSHGRPSINSIIICNVN